MRNDFKVFICAAILALFAITGKAVAAEKKMVLVAGSDIGALSLSRAEVRQLFFSGSLKKDDVLLMAVINDSDPLLYEVFLQKIVFMSARSYERRLISRVFNKGGRRVPLASNLDSLERRLALNPGWVSFMWEQQARSLQGITVIGELWQGSIN